MSQANEHSNNKAEVTTTKRKRQDRKEVTNNLADTNNANNNYSNTYNNNESQITKYNFLPLSACVFIESSEEVGSGVCISDNNKEIIILTAGHCCSEGLQSTRCIEFTDGVKYNATCISISDEFDLALLKLTTTYSEEKQLIENHTFACAKIAASNNIPKKNDSVYLVGQLGEPLKRSKRTLHNNNNNNNASNSSRQLLMPGKIIRLNKDPLCLQLDMGGIFHNCWVGGGLSGGPLFNANGEIIGIHTTADTFEGTAITLQAIHRFIQQSGVTIQ